MITPQAPVHMVMIIWDLQKNFSQFLGNIGSSRPNLIMHPSVANL